MKVSENYEQQQQLTTMITTTEYTDHWVMLTSKDSKTLSIDWFCLVEQRFSTFFFVSVHLMTRIR